MPSTLQIGPGGVRWPPQWRTEVDAVVDAVAYRLASPLGSVPGDQRVGLPYDDWYASAPVPSDVAALVRAQAEAVPEVRQSVATVSRVGDRLQIRLTLQIVIDDAEATVGLSTQIYQGQPVAWYVMDRR